MNARNTYTRRQTSSAGFTLVEVIAVLTVLAVLAMVVIPRLMTDDVDVMAETNIIKSQFRYSQLMAMKRGTVWGIRCDGTQYWLFNGTAPALSASIRQAPGADAAQISLAGRNIGMTPFTVYFDAYGRPFSAYTDAASNTPLTGLNITVSSALGGASQTITMIPETGYVP